jgi:hypothetical protein
MRIALLVGINHYSHIGSLHGCVNDAHNVRSILERHADGSINFDCDLMISSSNVDSISRARLIDQTKKLFNSDAEIALLYFSGHGYISSTGGYILASDASRGDEGVSLNDILTFANDSKAKNRIIILDSCHSGIAGTPSVGNNIATLSEGLTILTASTSDQYAIEENGQGLFTNLLVDALSGGAANLTGDITPGSIYAHIDQSLGAWEQRPVFKTNVKQFVSLRKVSPPISLDDLRKIKELFPTPGYEFKLDPSFEPESKGREGGMPEPDPNNTLKFALLQKYNRLNLLVPVNAPHMWHAAMENKSCKLTALGEHYRRLVEKNRI